ncbi:MAG: B12-binding domain-containing radical SAM protein, partial [Waltera sp.]
MKFLLTAINAKFIHSNPAIYSLRAGAGEKLQPYVELAEFTINESLESILEGIWKRQPKVIGFSCYIWNWKLIREILTELPKILPNTEIWLGGPEVTYDGPGLLREFPQVTGIMVGEGEVTFREVLDQYVREAESTGQSEQQPESGSTEQQAADRMGTVAGKTVAERFGQISGLCLASGYTAPRELTDLTTLPFLYEDMEPFTNRIIYYETSRGCPYRCSYCLSSIDKKVRLRDISVVKRELQFFLDQNVKQVKFIDRTFNCDHKHAMEIWRYIYEHDNGVTNFHFEISADILREEEIALLNRFRPGLAQLEIGVQST